MKKQPESEWSFPLQVETIGNTVSRYQITANHQECLDLAERFDVVSLDHVFADFTLTRERGGLVLKVIGTVRARVHQKCVVTLDPMVTEIEDHFEAFFADPEQAVSFARARADIKAKKGEVEVEMIDERDAPEEIINGEIDLGEVASQFLSLAIDPYPRAMISVTALPELTREAPNDQEENGPFAALKSWKEGLKE